MNWKEFFFGNSTAPRETSTPTKTDDGSFETYYVAELSLGDYVANQCLDSVVTGGFYTENKRIIAIDTANNSVTIDGIYGKYTIIIVDNPIQIVPRCGSRLNGERCSLPNNHSKEHQGHNSRWLKT